MSHHPPPEDSPVPKIGKFIYFRKNIKIGGKKKKMNRSMKKGIVGLM